MLLMGKSTISMAIFNSYVSHNQRVWSFHFHITTFRFLSPHAPQQSFQASSRGKSLRRGGAVAASRMFSGFKSVGGIRQMGIQGVSL
jgi:hypothetical protein